MIPLAAVEGLVLTQFQALVLRHPECRSALRRYVTSGGQETGAPWTVAGIYIHLAKQKRLVLEALHVEKHDGCVVRVYSEKPLEFFYARKVRHEVDACEELIQQAAQHFQLHFPRILLPADQFDIPQSLGPDVARALLPIPPPMSSCEIPD